MDHEKKVGLWNLQWSQQAKETTIGVQSYGSSKNLSDQAFQSKRTSEDWSWHSVKNLLWGITWVIKFEEENHKKTSRNCCWDFKNMSRYLGTLAVQGRWQLEFRPSTIEGLIKASVFHLRHGKGQQLWNRSKREAECPHLKQPSAHTVLASKRDSNIIQSLNTFLFTITGIQSKVIRYVRK